MDHQVSARLSDASMTRPEQGEGKRGAVEAGVVQHAVRIAERRQIGLGRLDRNPRLSRKIGRSFDNMHARGIPGSLGTELDIPGFRVQLNSDGRFISNAQSRRTLAVHTHKPKSSNADFMPGSCTIVPVSPAKSTFRSSGHPGPFHESDEPAGQTWRWRR